MPRKTLLLLLFVLPATVFGATFIVTSNADSGPGTLREALQNAQADGTSPIDSIIFLIPDISTGGRTITIQSELPAVGSNVFIDATSQPGLSYGLSDAMIKIQPGANFSGNSLLIIQAASSNISVYKLFLSGNSATHTQPVNNGILLGNNKNINIGDADKGNLITGCTDGIEFTGGQSSEINIVRNIIGLNEQTQINNTNETNAISINANDVINLTVNNNTLYGTQNAFRFNTTIKGISGSLTFNSNRIGTDIFSTALTSYPAVQASSLVYIGGNNPVVQYDSLQIFTVDIEGNVVTGNAVNGFYLGDGLTDVNITFAQNIVGDDKFAQPPLYKLTRGAFIRYAGRPYGSSKLSPAKFKQNSFYYCSSAGVTQEECYVYFDNNTFFCNAQGIISNFSSPNIITITSATESTITGTCSSDDNILIDLYTVKDCGSSGCQGYNKIGSLVKHGNGTTWSYCGYLTGKVVALSSYPGPSFYSSNFSNCIATPSTIKIINAVCPKNTGSITGIIIPTGATIQWKDSAGNVVGTNNNLLNVPPGTYYYEVQSSGCNYASNNFTIITAGIPGISDGRVKIFPEICGNDGSIQYLNSTEKDSIKWLNSAGDIVSTNLTLTNQPAGQYRFYAGKDSACSNETDWFTIPDDRTTINNNAFAITPASCNLLNGSIAYKDSFPADYFFWWSDPNNIRIDSNVYQINNLTPGNYSLHIKRITYDSSCIINYGPYAVTKTPSLTIDTTNVSVQNASCNNATGSITNIKITDPQGAVNYQWVDSTGKVVGNNLNLTNIPGGKYKLSCKDQSSCDTVSTAYFTVLNPGVISFDTTSMLVKAATCKGPDGFIKNISAINATSYQWINTATSAVAGNNIDLVNAAPGTYQLILNNALGCKVSTNNITIAQSVFAALTVTTIVKQDAHCNQQNGSVDAQQFNPDPSSYTFQWIDSATSVVESNSTQITNLDSGIYNLYATDSNGCRANIYSATILQTGVPTLNETNTSLKDDSCSLSTGAVLNVIAENGGGQYTWQWYNSTNQLVASTPNSLTGVAKDNYYVIVKDQYNCSVQSNTFTIGNADVILPLPQADDANILRGTSATIIVNNIETGIYQLYDDPSSPAPIATSGNGKLKTPLVFNDTTFYIRLKSGSCYSDFVPVKVFVFDKSGVLVPNAFSPNGDGINDTWQLKAIGIGHIDYLSIFNRYGQELFHTKNINKGWNGTVNGKPLPVGTYYYVIEATDVYGKLIKQSGSVTILK